MTSQDKTQGRWHRLAGACAVLAALAGCAVGDRGHDYANLSQNLRDQGLLRTERMPADAEFGLEDLIRNFRDIVFHYEFHFADGQLVDERIEKPLKRWEGRIRYRFTGDAVTARDRADVAALVQEISALTGLDFVEVAGAHDLLISIASREGRRAVSRELAEAGLTTYQSRYDIWRRTPGWVCGATLSAAQEDTARLVYGHVFLGAEVTGLLRTACLHEEIVQALGLTNDSDRARPSIFNDDQEFALMTGHDAVLLRALYDRRLRRGITAGEAAPLLRRVVADAMAASALPAPRRVAGAAPGAG